MAEQSIVFSADTSEQLRIVAKHVTACADELAALRQQREQFTSDDEPMRA